MGSLVPVADRNACPRCKGPTVAWTVSQPALFRHGGYGAVQARTYRSCRPCRAVRTVEVVEVDPRHR